MTKSVTKESVVKYYGKYLCEQLISGKPLNFDFKMSYLNIQDSHCINFDHILIMKTNDNDKLLPDEIYDNLGVPLKMMMKIKYTKYIDWLFIRIYFFIYKNDEKIK